MVDLGCGDGALSLEAATRLGATALVGVDSSPAMLERTAELVPPDGVDVAFERGDLATWTTTSESHRGWDLVLANASLQWVPDHEEVLRTLDRRARARVVSWRCRFLPTGCTPRTSWRTRSAPRSHFSHALGGQVPADPSACNVLAPEEYSQILFDLGYESQQVTLRVYPHVLGSSSDVVEWVRGTTLNRFFERLPADLHEPFVEAYRDGAAPPHRRRDAVLLPVQAHPPRRPPPLTRRAAPPIIVCVRISGDRSPEILTQTRCR